MPSNFPNLSIAVFAEAANLQNIFRLHKEGFVRGFTTNPTLMAKAGISDYAHFAKSLLSEVCDLPISFEVFSDDFSEMKDQARLISSWAKNVNVKIPVSNTFGHSSISLIRDLIHEAIPLNITAVFTERQMEEIREVLTDNSDIIVSVCAGRIADTGRDPIPLMKKAVNLFKDFPKSKVLWSSPREVLNIYQAEECGCDIITATEDLISKLPLYQKPLEEFSIDTVKMFYNDASEARYQLTKKT